MHGFGLLIGHLLGDYVFQNDWMAMNKVNPHPGPEPPWANSPEVWAAWNRKREAYLLGHLACLVHCVIYTWCVWACSCAWMPWWGLLVCFLTHYPMDRWRLAYLWMTHVSGQKAFASAPMAPWSIIVVDQCFHLCTLYGVARLAGVE